MGGLSQCVINSVPQLWNNFGFKIFNCSCILQVRYRKPRHLGRAPSKDRNYFKKYHPTDRDTAKSVLIYQNYNTIMKSLVAAFQEEIVMKEKTTNENTSSDVYVWNEESYHQKCMLYNDKENLRLKQLRVARIEKQRLKEEEAVRLQLTAEQLRQEREEAQLREEVLRTIEESKEWITLENMEEKITHAVDNPINFNFCLDENGLIKKRTAQILSDEYVNNFLEKMNETKSLTDN